MTSRRSSIFVFVLLAALLLAQAHFYAEGSLPHAQAHSCAICMAGLWAVPAPAHTFTATIESRRVEIPRISTTFHFQAPENLSPRAPPAS